MLCKCLYSPGDLLRAQYHYYYYYYYSHNSFNFGPFRIRNNHNAIVS
jgi:hypothetical protein